MTSPLETAVPSTPADIEATMLENLQQMVGDMAADMVAELAPLFVEDAKSNLKEIYKALKEGDTATADKVCHTLKGSSANMGLQVLSQISAAVMMAARQNNLDEARKLWPRLIAEFEQVRKVLAKYS
ncbi:MAG: hypothetical protein Kow0080_22520 [Candidatus Promineifilaceae bacterium]